MGKQPRNIKWEVNFVSHKQNYNPNRCFPERLGGIHSENVNSRSMDSSGVKVTHQSARNQSYKSGLNNFSQDFLSESTPFSSGQHNDSLVFDKNGRSRKQGYDSSCQGNLEIHSITENHNYYRVSARKIEC